MFHEADEERQILRFHPLLVKGEDILTANRPHQEVGILDPFGDALERNHLADLIKCEKGAQRVVRDFGVDSHVPSVEPAHRGRAMADPLNGVYKARQSPRVVVSRTPSGARPGRANSALSLRFERITTGRTASPQGPRYWRPEEIGSGVAPPRVPWRRYAGGH